MHYMQTCQIFMHSPPLTEVLHCVYSTLNAVMWIKICNRMIFGFHLALLHIQLYVSWNNYICHSLQCEYFVKIEINNVT